MPSDTLDKHDPAADTSKNPVLSRSSAHYVDPDTARFAQMLSCGMVRCSSTSGGTDGSALLIVLAALAATRRRNRS